MTVRVTMSENDIHAPLPRNEDDILAEFGRIRLEYNRLSKRNPEHTPRRMDLKARYRRLDRRYGRILARKRSAGGGNGYAEQSARSKPDSPKTSYPPAFTPLDNVPLDSGLAADDPFAADSSKDSLFGNALDSNDSGPSLLEEVIEADGWPGEGDAPAAKDEAASPLEDRLPPLDLPEPDDAAEAERVEKNGVESDMLMPAPVRDDLTASQLDRDLPEPLDTSAAFVEETGGKEPPSDSLDAAEPVDTRFEALDDEQPLPESALPTPGENVEEPARDADTPIDPDAEIEAPKHIEQKSDEAEPLTPPAADEVPELPVSAQASDTPPDAVPETDNASGAVRSSAESVSDDDALSAAERLADLVSDFATPQPQDVDPPEIETPAEQEVVLDTPTHDFDALGALESTLIEPPALPSAEEVQEQAAAALAAETPEMFEAFRGSFDDPPLAEEALETAIAPAERKAGAPLYTPRAKPIRRRRRTGAARAFTVMGWLTFLLGAAFVAVQAIPAAREAVQPFIESAGVEWLNNFANAIQLGAMVLLLGGTGVGIGAFLGRSGPPPVPLHQLVAKGDAGSILEAVAQGKPIDESDSRGHTPLHAAVVANRQDMTASLLELGADIEARTHKGETPLLLAVMEGDLDMTEFLMGQGADVFTKNNRDSTLMHAAAWTGDVRLLCLLKQKKLWVNAKALTGYTPLHFAAQGGHLDAIRCLLDMDADINAMSVKGNTPLYAAAKNGHLDAIEMLFAAGADPNIQQSQAGHSPLAIAMENGHHEVVAYLKKSGAEV